MKWPIGKYYSYVNNLTEVINDSPFSACACVKYVCIVVFVLEWISWMCYLVDLVPFLHLKFLI